MTGAVPAAGSVPSSSAAASFPARDALRRWAPYAVVAVAILGYLNALANGYVLDDRGVVLGNPLVTTPSGIWRAFAHPWWPAGLGGQYRPLVIASLSLDWWFSGGDAHWLHAVNVLWHAAASVLVWALAAELLAPAAALAASLLFALTPVHVEAVSNVVGRAECMAAAFVLAALLAHRRRLPWAPALFALAIFSKENGAVFVALAAAHDLLLAGPPRAAFRERRLLYAGYAAAFLVWAAAASLALRGEHFAAPAHVFDGAGTGERLLTVAATIPDYARLLLVPFDLSADYGPAVRVLVRGVTPGVVSGVLLAVLLGALIFRAWRAAPAAAFGLLWVPIAIAPVSNVLFATGVLLAERTLYLPSVGAMLALGWLIGFEGDRWPRATTAAVAAVLVAYGVRTWTRTEVWHDPRTFALDLVREHPESYRGHWVIGRVFAAQGQYAKAEQEYATARELFDGDPVVWAESGELRVVAKDLEGATAMYERALAIRPDAWEMQMGYARVLLAKGDSAAARAHAERAVALSGGAPPAVAVRARAEGTTQ